MRNQTILVFFFLLFSLPSTAQVKVAEFENKAAYNVANYAESHNVESCSSERTKRRAHFFSNNLKHKQLDNELINRCFATCELLAQSGASEAVSCVRECNDRERENRQNVKNGIISGAGILTTAVTLFKAL